MKPVIVLCLIFVTCFAEPRKYVIYEKWMLDKIKEIKSQYRVYFPDIFEGLDNDDFINESTEDEKPFQLKNCKNAKIAFTYSSFHHEILARRLMDATAKLQSGIMVGNQANLGDFDECLAIKEEMQSDSIGFNKLYGKYCLGNVTIHRDVLRSVFKTNITSDVTTKWGMCIPHLCYSERSLLEFAKYYTKTFAGNISIRFNYTFNDDMCQWKETYTSFDAGAVCAVVFFSAILTIVLLSTAYDIYLQRTEQQSIAECILAFSIYSNGKKLLSTANSEEQFTCIDGIRFLSVLWIILGTRHHITKHTLGVVGNTDVVEQWQKTWYNRYADGYTYGVDSLLLVNALLVVYNYLDNKAKGQIFNLPNYYINRLIRYTPSLIAFVLFCATLLPYISSGPEYPIFLQRHYETCQKYWWATILYMHNYIFSNDMCVPQAWFLDVDMHMYILAPVFLIALSFTPNWAINGILLVGLSSLATTFLLSWNYGLFGVQPDLMIWEVYWSVYYVVSHTRCIPWIIGAILGYYIYKFKNQQTTYSLRSIYSNSLWVASILIMFTCVFLPQSALNSNYLHDGILNSTYLTFSRPLWALSVGWLIFACILNQGDLINKFLSMDSFQVMAKFSFSMYLLHETLIYLTVYSRRTHIFYSNSNMFYYACGDIFMTFIFALAWVLAFEMPFSQLGKMLLISPGNFAGASNCCCNRRAAGRVNDDDLEEL